MIGLLLVQLLRAAGCGQVIAVDLDPSRLELACELGATHVLRGGQPDDAASALELTGGRGADVAFEAVGVTGPLDTAAHCLRKGGTLTLIGNLAPRVDLPLQFVVTRQIRLQGACASAGEYPTCIDLIARGAVRAGPLISAVAPLSEGDAVVPAAPPGGAGAGQGSAGGRLRRSGKREARSGNGEGPASVSAAESWRMIPGELSLSLTKGPELVRGCGAMVGIGLLSPPPRVLLLAPRGRPPYSRFPLPASRCLPEECVSA